MLEFKSQGAHGEDLHFLCDVTMVNLEFDENHPEFDIVTTGDATTDLALAFWECFCAVCLPERADWSRLKIVCVSLDGTDYRGDLQGFLQRFANGWIPDG